MNTTTRSVTDPALQWLRDGWSGSMRDDAARRYDVDGKAELVAVPLRWIRDGSAKTHQVCVRFPDGAIIGDGMVDVHATREGVERLCDLPEGVDGAALFGSVGPLMGRHNDGLMAEIVADAAERQQIREHGAQAAPATAKQVDYAMSLIDRGLWRDATDLGGPVPTRSELAAMDRATISGIIDDLKSGQA